MIRQIQTRLQPLGGIAQHRCCAQRDRIAVRIGGRYCQCSAPVAARYLLICDSGDYGRAVGADPRAQARAHKLVRAVVDGNLQQAVTDALHADILDPNAGRSAATVIIGHIQIRVVELDVVAVLIQHRLEGDAPLAIAAPEPCVVPLNDESLVIAAAAQAPIDRCRGVDEKVVPERGNGRLRGRARQVLVGPVCEATCERDNAVA